MSESTNTYLVGPRREFRSEFPVSRVKTILGLVGMTSGRSWSRLGLVTAQGTPTQAKALFQTKKLLVSTL